MRVSSGLVWGLALALTASISAFSAVAASASHSSIPRMLRSAPSPPTAGLSHITTRRATAYRALPRSEAVRVYFDGSSSCGLLAGATVKETRSEIRFTITVGDLGSICLSDLVGYAAVVRLSAPVGQRRIVDDFHARLGRVAVRLEACCSTLPVRVGFSPPSPGSWVVRLLDAAGNVAAIRRIRPGHTSMLTAPVGRYTLVAPGCFSDQQVNATSKRSRPVMLRCLVA